MLRQKIPIVRGMACAQGPEIIVRGSLNSAHNHWKPAFKRLVTTTGVDQIAQALKFLREVYIATEEERDLHKF
jgi:hypothetical protein